MAYLFRSFKMIIISLLPNLLPLIITAGLMGYLGVPIKPSTILVFSIAFGISVDDTIHFLAKYRQELQANHWKIRKSVYGALRETGVSMFYTSIVLFFGFSVFVALYRDLTVLAAWAVTLAFLAFADSFIYAREGKPYLKHLGAGIAALIFLAVVLVGLNTNGAA